MYTASHKSYVFVEGIDSVLCGKFRPGHFKGVATVVTKLFNIINPDAAYFGQKDAQQAIIIKKITDDLNMPVKIRTMPIIREKDGLAMSSRNAYLNKTEREDAAVLFRALCVAKGLAAKGEKSCARIIKKMCRLINNKKSAKIQYIAIVDAQTLEPLGKIKGKALVALAVWIGNTRLIDNIIVNPDH